MLGVILVVLGVSGLWLLTLGTTSFMNTTPVPSATSVDEVSSITTEASSTRTREIVDQNAPNHNPSLEETEWGELVMLSVGGVPVRASVADTLPERIAGLSNTAALPKDMVKLFVFESDGPQSIWMKDMRYPIDIMWFDAGGELVYLEEAVDPDTYPQSFASPIPARYVIEANAGFVATHGITKGDRVVFP